MGARTIRISASRPSRSTASPSGAEAMRNSATSASMSVALGCSGWVEKMMLIRPPIRSSRRAPLACGLQIADQALPVTLHALEMCIHQCLGQVAVAGDQRLVDPDMFLMRPATAREVAEIDRQPLLPHRVIDAADAVEHAVLRRTNDFEMEFAVLLG